MTTTTVSVIVPCFNEGATIGKLLDAIRGQTYSLSAIEVIIADGMSTDDTRVQIGAYATEHPELCVRVVDNPKRIIPAALNQALQAASGEIIVRLDGHALPYPDFIEGCVAGLNRNAGEAIGSVLEIRPGADGWIAASIAAATAHPFGVGDALYRHARRASFADTFAFGAFRRELVDQVGSYDESLGSNEDYEFNARIRAAGGRIWLDPAIRSVYFSRPTLRQLAAQYWRYGFWKWRMLRRHPATLRWRQALPPLFLLGLVALCLAAIFVSDARVVLGVYTLVYLGSLLVVGLVTGIRERRGALTIGMCLAMVVMHFSWASGFLWSMAGGKSRRT